MTTVRCVSLLVAILAGSAGAEVRLPNIISDGMVLQQKTPTPIWGKAAVGEKVTVTFAGQTKTATVGKDRRWSVTLDPLDASASPRVMTINDIKISDVLVGEVWLASGDGGMEFNLAELPEEEKKIAFAQKGDKLLRMYCVAEHYQVPMGKFFKGDKDAGAWSRADQFIPKFQKGLIEPYHSHSAVGFFFAMKLQKQLGVPVAVLDSSMFRNGIPRWISDVGYQQGGTEEYRKIVRYRPVSEQLQGRLLDMFKGVGAKSAQWAAKAELAAENGEYNPFPYSTNSKIRALNAVYFGMIHPMVPYAFKGTVWYHGECDVNERNEKQSYYDGLKTLVNGRRKLFGNPEMPFLVLMLDPNKIYTPRNSDDAGKRKMCDRIWSAQMRVADEIEGVSAIPIHDTLDIKKEARYYRTPTHKLAVGLRVADNALKLVYGKQFPAGGPKFAGAKLDGDKVIVSFKGIDKQLSVRGGGELVWFELAGADKKFVKAQGVISGRTVIVTAAEIATPKFVQMGWRNDAAPLLTDKNGLPAYPFGPQSVK
ncbi:MAG: sialate O-acetylesterase [Phycisphaerae bacterium]|nr:sialate O-acetylesterase [Phycisphaerae bacterium]